MNLKTIQDKLEVWYAIPILGIIPSVINLPITTCRWIRTKVTRDYGGSFVNPSEQLIDDIIEYERDKSVRGFCFACVNILTLSCLKLIRFCLYGFSY